MNINLTAWAGVNDAPRQDIKMNRRKFLKSLAVVTGSIFIPLETLVKMSDACTVESFKGLKISDIPVDWVVHFDDSDMKTYRSTMRISALKNGEVEHKMFGLGFKLYPESIEDGIDVEKYKTRLRKSMLYSLNHNYKNYRGRFKRISENRWVLK